MAERNLHVDHVTIWRWVQRYAPELNRRCRQELRTTNGSWRIDETYLRIGGKWTYLYRAVDSTGATIDFLLSANRDAAAAKRFRSRPYVHPAILGRGWIRRVPVHIDHSRARVTRRPQRLLQPLCGCRIPSDRQQKINRATRRIHGAI